MLSVNLLISICIIVVFEYIAWKLIDVSILIPMSELMLRIISHTTTVNGDVTVHTYVLNINNLRCISKPSYITIFEMFFVLKITH